MYNVQGKFIEIASLPFDICTWRQMLLLSVYTPAPKKNSIQLLWGQRVQIQPLLLSKAKNVKINLFFTYLTILILKYEKYYIVSKSWVMNSLKESQSVLLFMD